MEGAQRTPEPSVMVIFGATGDLTERKLIPALFHLYQNRRLPPNFIILGFARRDWSDELYRNYIQEEAQRHLPDEIDEQAWESFLQRLFLQRGSFGDSSDFKALAERIQELEERYDTNGNVLYYLAAPPDWFAEITTHLKKAGLAQREQGWQRLVVEKPFGHDLASAQKLNRHLNAVFDEEQIYRIDHYLGKETVQNILVFRFANAIWEPIWNRQHIDHVQITVAESIGIGDRAGYYDETGALRDMVQNHLMQLLTLVAMEPPVRYEAGSVRDEKTKVLRQIRPVDIAHDAVRGQYRAGSVGGSPVAGYREEEDVPDDSTRETFTALKLYIESWRWVGVPFYLRTGKRLPKKVTEIAVIFREAPRVLFDEEATDHLEHNTLALRIQPDEGISLTFGAKMPGIAERIRNVTMDFDYGASFGLEPPDAYERLLLDALLGDPTLFTRRDEVEAAWALVDPILDVWDDARTIPSYEAGSWGPQEAHDLIQADGRRWRRL
ncbi:MAG: glucose-6-phosphate dehydrogenase [Chloroflexota bacterium]|nr:glucose-6-phosphate dehydrogenase [Chloroflexota bacterium]